MSLLLSDDVFNFATDTQSRTDKDVDDTATSCDCEETRDDVDKQPEVAQNCNTESSQSEHVDCKMSTDSISDGTLADEVRSSDESVRSLATSTSAAAATAVDTSRLNIADEQCEVNAHRQHGVHSFRYALHIDIASHIRVEHTDDNDDVVRTLQELTSMLVNRYTPTVKRWLEVFIHNNIVGCRFLQILFFCLTQETFWE